MTFRAPDKLKLAASCAVIVLSLSYSLTLRPEIERECLDWSFDGGLPDGGPNRCEQWAQPVVRCCISFIDGVSARTNIVFWIGINVYAFVLLYSIAHYLTRGSRNGTGAHAGPELEVREGPPDPG